MSPPLDYLYGVLALEPDRTSHGVGIMDLDTDWVLLTSVS